MSKVASRVALSLLVVVGLVGGFVGVSVFVGMTLSMLDLSIRRLEWLFDIRSIVPQYEPGLEHAAGSDLGARFATLALTCSRSSIPGCTRYSRRWGIQVGLLCTAGAAHGREMR